MEILGTYQVTGLKVSSGIIIETRFIVVACWRRKSCFLVLLIIFDIVSFMIVGCEYIDVNRASRRKSTRLECSLEYDTVDCSVRPAAASSLSSRPFATCFTNYNTTILRYISHHNSRSSSSPTASRLFRCDTRQHATDVPRAKAPSGTPSLLAPTMTSTNPPGSQLHEHESLIEIRSVTQ